MSSKNESPVPSINSLILPPPPLSVFSDYSFENKLLYSENLALENELPNGDKINFLGYTKKFPVHFISGQDCKKYTQFMHEISLLKYNNGLYMGELWNDNERNDQIMRLFFAFYKLYQEYSDVCDFLLSSNVNHNESGDNFYTFQDSLRKNYCNCKSNGKEKMEFKDAINQTENISMDRNFSMTNIENEVSISPDNHSLMYGLRTFFKTPFKFGTCLKTGDISKSTENYLNMRSMIYDKITDKNLEVYEFEKYNCRKIIHKIALENKNKSTKFQTMKIPIALELLLPKIQNDIEIILTQCPFLCDPLEVMAELRNCNYDQIKCVRYFKKSRYLRYLYNQQSTERQKLIKTNSCEILNSTTNDNEFSPISSNYKNISFSSICKFPIHEIIHINPDDKISEKNTNNSIIQTENEEQVNQYVVVVNKLKTVREIQHNLYEDVLYLAKQLNKVFDSLRNHMIAVINQCSDRLITNDQKIKLLAFSRQVEELKLKLKIEENKRRQVYNRMQEQMGNVRVCCRCRNLSDENILDYSGEDTLILTTAFNERFEFDKVFQPGVSQADLYEEFRPLVMSFIDGYNVCFITYGGEASGKTYTLIGDNRDPAHQGIMQRSLVTILTEERFRQRDWDYKISACVVEIYNDNCTDILSGESGIQIYVDNGMETAFQKLKSVPITNEADADVLIQVCTVKRKVARTALNPASSRSHLIILIRLQGCSKIHGENICSFLCLCDLAGFEDIIKAETQTNKVLSKEAGYINRSLTAFNRVFVSLKKQDPNTVCYRDTKLTHLLKPFLTNSGKCALIVTVRNDRRSMGSTHNTLRFGKETRGVTLGKARRQVHINNLHQRTS